MSANSGTTAPSVGFNQQSGGYYITFSSIQGVALTITEGSGSGGATTAPSFAAYSWTGAGLNSSLVNASGKLIRDMGRHVYSAGRAFRKFQAVGTTADGVQGPITPNAGYLTFYLEMPKGGLGPNGGSSTTYPQIARFS